MRLYIIESVELQRTISFVVLLLILCSIGASAPATMTASRSTMARGIRYKTGFRSAFIYAKNDRLPRQARDKSRRKNSPKRRLFSYSRWPCSTRTALETSTSVRKRNPCFALPYNIRTKAIHCQFAKTGSGQAHQETFDTEYLKQNDLKQHAVFHHRYHASREGRMGHVDAVQG